LYKDGIDQGNLCDVHYWQAKALAQTEHNFCPRCGKRTKDIHTCTPPQRTWVDLTDDDKKQITKGANYHWEMTAGEYAERIGQLTEAKVKEKNI
jgi:hypothetical protein